MLIAAAAVAGGLVYGQLADVARAGDGTEGFTLIYAASVSEALGRFVALSVPVLVLAVLAAAAGNPLSGVFVVAVALLFPAIRGGTIDQFIANAKSPSDFLGLGAESLLWAAAIGVFVLVVHRLAHSVRGIVPPAWRAALGDGNETVESDVEGEAQPKPDTTVAAIIIGAFACIVAIMKLPSDWQLMQAIPVRLAVSVAIGFAGGAANLFLVRVVDQLRHRPGMTASRVRIIDTISGSAMCVLIGGASCWLLMRSTDTWQVVWSPLIAFMLAALAARHSFPCASAVALLLCPMFVAAVSYVIAAVSFSTSDQMLQGFYIGQFFYPAMALPIYYASAGVAGAALGIGWSEGLFAARHMEAEAVSTSA